MIAGLRMNDTPILSETAGYGWAGLRLRYALAGPGNAVRELRRLGAGAFPSVVGGITSQPTANRSGGCSLLTANGGVDDVGLRLRRN